MAPCLPAAQSRVKTPKGKDKATKRSSQPRLANVVIECPSELSPVARQEWDRIVPQLAAADRLSSLDRGPLAIYCTAFAAWLEAVTALQTYGTVMKSPSGYPLQSPYVSIATKQAEIMIRIASEFGFTPAARMRLPRYSRGDLMPLDLSGFQPLDPLDFQPLD